MPPPPETPEAYGPRELARDLQRLVDLPARTKPEVKAWYEEAFAVQDRIRSSKELWDIPHSLWHFFSDADIRAKDPEYGEQQLEQVRRHIEVLATGAVPPDDSTPVSFGTLFGELWDALRGRAR